jgi:hypothetical protein
LESFIELHEPWFDRQYVVRPPEVSKTDPVVKLHSSLAMKQIMAALSATSPRRPIGIFARM